MTHTYDETGKWLTVTRLALGPCTVLQSRNMEKDGYRAVQLSFGTKRNTTKPMAGHLKKERHRQNAAFYFRGPFRR